ncbi:glycosyltransferase family 2 protein [Leptospira borgpetersenii serovar Hardjo-bovis]|uniref:Glycosyltransferase, group 2 family protein n=1 Tax=Leptospira borgpetersenii serovar Hardjo-bovis str. Sponselee TaxID=1303729 RepID=M6BQV8_LEPBO|nr:glycosyltransferase family 2 protein [Leptospira borgpetersenii]ABJ78363.1 Glycosyltransferase [Leptospira borgpetersenii serovar Hardjo-bovis str. L550]AMX57590.1 glycosyltransferase [Leptospira borgpetersenii serovar Hardjo]AMX60823.1 glycosyltransferase [Leptospira borgpetersenii serovar Hardjo]AMX64068.1 glycosyltransferase [Leptospira borgpetersenii serovar Hardjo]AMX67308.1 glycosyltransferase [Leptospira borgpetersenii serovar Hardjo]
MAERPPLLSVVIPIYNEEKTIPELTRRLRILHNLLSSKHSFKKDDLEILFVNDGSRDESFSVLKKFCSQTNGYKLVNLSRNYGHQTAITAGIDTAVGEAVVVMDGDLQDPPEFVSDLYGKLLEGYDVVYAKRKKRPGESWFKLSTAHIFYRILKEITKFDIPIDTGDFRIMSRRVTDVLCSMREQHRYIRGLISWIGFKQIGLEYEREERFEGVTKFSLGKMLKFALDGITSFSSAPLKLSSYLGFFTAFCGAIYALYVVYLRIFTSETITGWSSMMIVVLILGGTQLLALGMIGEYLSRVNDESKNRPLYVIEDIYSSASQKRRATAKRKR